MTTSISTPSSSPLSAWRHGCLILFLGWALWTGSLPARGQDLPGLIAHLRQQGLTHVFHGEAHFRPHNLCTINQILQGASRGGPTTFWREMTLHIGRELGYPNRRQDEGERMLTDQLLAESWRRQDVAFAYARDIRYRLSDRHQPVHVLAADPDVIEFVKLATTSELSLRPLLFAFGHRRDLNAMLAAPGFHVGSMGLAHSEAHYEDGILRYYGGLDYDRLDQVYVGFPKSALEAMCRGFERALKRGRQAAAVHLNTTIADLGRSSGEVIDYYVRQLKLPVAEVVLVPGVAAHVVMPAPMLPQAVSWALASGPQPDTPWTWVRDLLGLTAPTTTVPAIRWHCRGIPGCPRDEL